MAEEVKTVSIDDRIEQIIGQIQEERKRIGFAIADVSFEEDYYDAATAVVVSYAVHLESRVAELEAAMKTLMDSLMEANKKTPILITPFGRPQ